MEDRKTRIAKLSERFKPHAGRPTRAPKQRQRRSFYLDIEIAERLDRDYKEFNHQAYPRTVTKSEFMEAVLEYGLNHLPGVKALLEEPSETGQAETAPSEG